MKRPRKGTIFGEYQAAGRLEVEPVNGVDTATHLVSYPLQTGLSFTVMDVPVDQEPRWLGHDDPAIGFSEDGEG